MRPPWPLILLLACALSACDQPQKSHAQRPAAESRIERSIDIPGGTVHVVSIPSGLESTRCVVVMSTTQTPAVSCAPKDIDLGQEP